MGHADHRALLYGDADEFLDAVVPFVSDGLRAEERVLVALMPEKLAWLREALGDDADAAELADASAMYARNGPMLSWLLGRLAAHGTPGEGRIRVVAEQALATRTPADTRAYMRYEAAANVAYQPFAASVLCPYDTTRLPDAVLRTALQTHPERLHGRASTTNDAFIDPREFIRRYSRVEPPAPDAIELVLDQVDDLSPARRRIAALAHATGVAQPKIDELKVALGELAANALIHGDAPRRIYAYVRDDAFVCHVHDSGHGLADPLTGYLAPDTNSTGGRGLWLAHQLCETVEATTDQTGTHVCIRITL